MSDEARTHQEELIRLIDQQYRPEPLHRGELDVLRTRIRARSERPRRAAWPAWGAVASAGLALMVWWAQPEPRAPEAVDALLLPAEALQTEPASSADDFLPQDYAAIEALFLDG